MELRPPDPVESRAELAVGVPPSKSIALRALAAAAVAGGGVVRLGSPPWPGDVAVMIEGLRRLGVPLGVGPDGVSVDGPVPPGRDPVAIDARDGGAPARFLLALAARLAGTAVTVDGTPRLRERPMGPLLDALRSLGARVDGGPQLPVTIRGPLRGSPVAVASGVSSQFASALLLVGAGLEGGLALDTGSEVASRPYLDLTREVLGRFGVVIGSDLRVPATAARPATVDVEGDWSGAAVVLAAAAFLPRTCVASGVDPDSRQPDVRAVEILRRLGLQVATGDRWARASGRVTRGGSIDLGATPDLVPVVAALGALAPDPVVVTGCAQLRHKESDRIATLVELLQAVAVGARACDDGLEIEGGMPRRAQDARPARVRTHGDHRIVMAAALLALRRPVVLDDAACVEKSFPGFFRWWPGRINP